MNDIVINKIQSILRYVRRARKDFPESPHAIPDPAILWVPKAKGRNGMLALEPDPLEKVGP